MPVNLNPSFSSIGRRSIGIANNALAESFAKLASGRGINKAADNAAGLAISEQLISDIRSSEQAQRNISAGAALTRTAEGGLSEVSNLLARGRELSLQAANGTLNNEQRSNLQNEIVSIRDEINRISGVTEFNGQKLLNGDLAPGSADVSVQAGIQGDSSGRISLNVVDDTSAAALNLNSVDISTQAGARSALSVFDNAIGQVSATRSNIGALSNRFDSAANNLSISRENLIAANSAIRDLDFAAEISNKSKNSILQQSAVNALGKGLEAQRGLIGGLLNITG